MKHKIIVISVVVLIATVLSSCGDLFPIGDSYKKAKENHKFFRCKINGKEWHREEDSDWFGGNNSGASFYEGPDSVAKSGRFSISVFYNPDKTIDEGIKIEVRSGLKEGVNLLHPLHYQGSTYTTTTTYWTSTPIYEEFYLDSSYYNRIYITDIDTSNLIITGQFEFKAISWDKIDTVMITDGEFDWKPAWYRYK